MREINVSYDKCFEQNKWSLGVWELNESTVTVFRRSNFEGLIFKLRSLSSKFSFERDLHSWGRSNTSPKAGARAIGSREEARLSHLPWTISEVGNACIQEFMPAHQCFWTLLSCTVVIMKHPHSWYCSTDIKQSSRILLIPKQVEYNFIY